MLKWLIFVAAWTATSPAPAQDIAGLEDCSQARGPDKKIGCLQSNVEFLHKMIRTNDASAQAKLSAATVKIGELQSHVERLRTALEQLEKKIPPTPNPPASPTPKP